MAAIVYRIYPVKKGVVCPNSMHSRYKVEQRYSFINQTMLEAIYGGCKRDCKKTVN